MTAKSKPKIFGTLMAEVIRKDLCTLCGTCVATCPVGILKVEDGKPVLKGKCSVCEICYYNCARADFSLEDAERYVFERRREEGDVLGIMKSCYIGRSKREDILKNCQDGGVATSVLAYLLSSNQMECAIVSGIDDDAPWKPKPVVALKYDEIVECSGTKYTPSPTIIGLGNAVDEYMKSKVAVVGTPCQIQAVRRMQTSRLVPKKLADAVGLTIGLFCMESYSYSDLMKYLDDQGIKPSDVTRFDIKKGRFKVQVSGEEALNVALKEVKQYVRSCCNSCSDFTAELADISVGGMGCPEGWSTVVTRTERGEKALRGAESEGFLELKPVGDVESDLSSVIKLSKIKRKRKS